MRKLLRGLLLSNRLRGARGCKKKSECADE